MRTHKTLATVTLVGCAAAAAGCGSVSPTQSTTGAARIPVQAAFAFARCIRAHGVTNFPDPQVSTTPGSTAVRQAVPSSAVASPAFKTAQRACASVQPLPRDGGPNAEGPPKQVLLDFARCVRAHGVRRFPDPNGQGQLTLGMISTAGVDVHAPGFLSAGRACVGVTRGAITVAALAAAASHRH